MPLHWYGGLFANDPTGTGALRNSDDVGVMLVAFGGPSVGKLGSSEPSRRRGAGLRALAAARHQRRRSCSCRRDDQLAAWDPTDGTMRPAFPARPRTSRSS